LVDRRLLLVCLLSLGAVLAIPDGIAQGDSESDVNRYGVHFFSSSEGVLKAWEPQQGLGPGKDSGYQSAETPARAPVATLALAPEPTSIPTSTPEPSPTATDIPTSTSTPIRPTAVPTNTAAPPTATATTPPTSAPTSTSSVKESFIAGWYAGGGSEALLPKALAVIQCESTWNVYAQNGIYRGLGQWDSTWWSFGGGDIYSPWQQGHNMAVRVNREGWRAWECA
jgi:hypothetical protein